MKALLLDTYDPRPVQIFADSAIARSGYPLFVPDVCGPWRGCVCPAVKIGRLGKCIAPKFAMRYVEAVEAVHVMQSDEAGGLSFFADGAIVQGEALNIDSVGETFTLTVTDGTGTTKNTMPLADLDIPHAIASVSTLATLKTGDIIIFRNFAIPTNLENTYNKYIEAAVNDCTCIKFKVK